MIEEAFENKGLPDLKSNLNFYSRRLSQEYYSEAFRAASSSSLHFSEKRLAECYQKTREALDLLIEAAGLLEGYREFGEMNDRLLKLKGIIASERLESLLTYQTTESLFNQVGDFWNESDYQKGMIVLRICKKRLRTLLEKTTDTAAGDRLNERLNDIYRLSERAEAFVSGGAITDSREITAVRNIIKRASLF